MDCILKTNVPNCQMSGPADKSATVKVVPVTKGAVASIIAANYDGEQLKPNNDELTFTIKAGRKPLSITYSVTGDAELHEKCDGNTLLDDAINPTNNVKLYFVCGETKADLGGAQ